MKHLLLPPLLFLTSLLCSQSKVDSIELGNPYIQNYGPDDYQGHMQNWAITQDNYGFIYASNGDGILQYDGESWRFIPLAGSNAVRTIAVDANNVKWVGADRELGYLEPDSLGFLQFKSLKNKIPPTHPLTASVWNVFAVRDGIVFRGGDTIYLWKNDNFQIVPNSERIHTGFQVGEDLFFRLYDKGLYQLIDNSLQLIPDGDIFKDLRVYSMLPFEDHSLLLGTRDAGLFLYDGTSVKRFHSEIDDYIVNNRLHNGIRLPDSTYAFATLRGGLIFMDKNGNEIRTLTVKNGLLNDEVYGICLDNRNGLWLSLQTGISYIEHLQPYTFFDEKLGIEGTVDAIIRHKGTLYVATYAGLFRGEFSSIAGSYKFVRIETINSGCTSLLSAESSLIVLTDDGTLLIKDDAVKKINNIKGVVSYRSQMDPSRIFIGHKEGLSTLYFSQGEWQNESHFPQIHEEPISVTEDKNGMLWLGTRLEGTLGIEFSEALDTIWSGEPENMVIRRFNKQKGLPDGWNKVYALDGQLWVTANSEIGRLFLFDPGKKTFFKPMQFGKRFGLDSLDVYPLAVQSDARHILLKSNPHNGKSYRFSAFKNTETKEYTVEQLHDERFKDNDEVFWDSRNSLWLGAEEVVKYNLSKAPTHNPPFKTYIRKVQVGQDSVIFGGIGIQEKKPILAYSNNGLRFQFATPLFENRSGNSYQYFLKGFDKEWSGWTVGTQKEYTNISEGDYQFMVRAHDVSGKISEPGIFDFQILPPWYRTWWAYFSYMLLFISFLWIILRWRSRQLKAKNEALEKLIMLRTSEVQHQANQLRIQAEKLQELDKAKSRFFANISHEFRTPLTLIKGPIEQLEQNFTETLNLETVKMIRRNANRLLNMVNQLLALSKIDEGSLKLAPTEGDVYKCLRAAASSFNSHAAQRDMDYRVQIPQTLLWASFDRDKLENIVYNLLGNAFKFTENGSEIAFSSEYTEYGLQIQVSDSGKGIPEEMLPFIFDRFYQVDTGNTKEKEGSGIGLSLSKDLVELMDGTITVSSEMGKGALFTVQLPIQEIKTRSRKAEVIETLDNFKLKNKPFELSKTDKRIVPNILLVEDNSDMRHFIKAYLIKSYKVKEAVNGQIGLQKAIADPPDLIITDLMMPKMDGIELCKKLKTDVHTSHIPVIMLTAKAGMKNKIEGLETGADDYLTKPFDGKELLVRIKNLIGQRRKLRELFSNREVNVAPKKVTVTSIDQKFLEQLLELLEAHFSDPNFGVPQMQKALAMSKTQLHRKLKALTNEAPGELLRNFRLKRAAQLLAQKADSVTQIAYKVGFNNLSYFAKCFKELYGVAPSSYWEQETKHKR
ncbi:response regulator [Pricia sp.]|uniref:hybrid sensor histidine kinase/response regulator transcription factor n=1 Tax=Pricia sp. TaxID=2268138 RepID=UPI0035943CA2